MVNNAFLFPGQGSQSVGMGKIYWDRSDIVKSLFNEADQILGFSIQKIMFDGPEEVLKQTVHTQPALFLASAAALELIKAKGIKAKLAAGHSLGEYSALYCAGVLSFQDALTLVHARGKAMQDAAEKNPGKMAAVIGLKPDTVSEICAKINSESNICVPANFNTAQQTVIAGHADAISKAIIEFQNAGAAKVVELNVSGAFHSPLMSPAVEIMKPLIEETAFNNPHIPVVTNVDAEPTTDPAKLKEKLILQIDHPVQWEKTMPQIFSEAETIIEVGSGKVLSSMAKRLDRSKTFLWTDDLEGLEKKISALSSQN